MEPQPTNDVSITGDCPWCGEWINLEVDEPGCDYYEMTCPHCGKPIQVTVVHEYILARDSIIEDVTEEENG